MNFELNQREALSPMRNDKQNLCVPPRICAILKPES